MFFGVSHVRKSWTKWMLSLAWAAGLCGLDGKAADWSFTLPTDTFSSPAVASDGSIIIGCGQGINGVPLSSINPAGKLNWTIPIGSVMASPAISADDTIYAGSTLGYFYSISLDGKTNWVLKTSDSNVPASG